MPKITNDKQEITPKISTTEQKILGFVQENFEVSTKDIVEFLEISPQATHRHLKKLVEQNRLKRMGTPPKVFYKVNLLENFKDLTLNLKKELELNQGLLQIVEKKIQARIPDSLAKIQDELDNIKQNNFLIRTKAQELANFLKNIETKLKDFLVITPQGEILTGLSAFVIWCQKRNLPFAKTFVTYLDLQQRYQQFKTPDNNFIVATDKFKNTFKNDTQIDEVYYCDFYSIEIFGKTKLGSLLLHGKQSQNLKIIKQVCDEVKPKILEFIEKNQIEAVAFIPPTTPRNPQFMDEFRKSLNLKIPVLKLGKIVNDIAIQQKTLKSSQDRIENAQNTIFVDDKRKFKNILLLDDAVGSGSTFNEIGRKFRQKKLVENKIYALAIVGSANGIVDNSPKFEVINEV